MKRVAALATIISAFALFGAKSALAVDLVCDGADFPGHCDITSVHILPAGTYTTPLGSPVLHISLGGELRFPGGATPTTLQIAGDGLDGLIMDNGGKITGNTTGATGVGATLNIIVATGSVRLSDNGTAITADNTAGAGCVNGHGG